MNLLIKYRLSAYLSICIVLICLAGQQAYANASNTLGYEGAGLAFPAEIGMGVLVGRSDSEHVILLASSDETDLAECYGDELEVSLRSVIDADGTVLERTVFAFPNPNGWLVTVLGTGGQLLNFLPCQVEPINATGLWGGFIDPRLGHGKFSVPGIEGVRVRSVRFFSPGPKATEDIEARRAGTILAAGGDCHDEIHGDLSDDIVTGDAGAAFFCDLGADDDIRERESLDQYLARLCRHAKMTGNTCVACRHLLQLPLVFLLKQNQNSQYHGSTV